MLEGRIAFPFASLSLYNKVEMKLKKKNKSLLFLFFIKAIAFMIHLGYISPLYLQIIPQSFQSFQKIFFPFNMENFVQIFSIPNAFV